MSYLDAIIAKRRTDVEEARRRVPLSSLRERALSRQPSRDIIGALRTGRPAIIAEFKRSSPSAGAIATRDAARTAAAYQRGGAAAISVLTEARWFNGCLDDLTAVRSACDLPTLRKDFIVDEYQVWESAAAGADALLLIAAALPGTLLGELHALTEMLDVRALVEVHDEAEAERALDAGARMIGVNNRDLRTFTVDLQTALRVRRVLPDDRVIVAESGYGAARELAQCAEAGIDSVLIGEALMRAADPEAALRSLRGALV